MAKRPAITEESVRKALRRAQDGEGHQLAMLLKSVSTKDLARAISRAAPYYKAHADSDLFLYGIGTVFAVVEGIRSAKAEVVQWKKDYRKKRRAERGSDETGEVSP